MALHWICPPIEVRLEDDGVRVDLNTGNTLAVPVPGGPPGRPGDPGPVGPGIPPGGAAGQYFRKASAEDYDGEWVDLPAPPVQSVNGKTGPVELDADDVGALPDTTPLFSGDYDDLTNKPSIPSPQTSGTPADLGTAARGTAATYARSDHVHNVPSVLAGGTDGISFQTAQITNNGTRTLDFGASGGCSAVVFVTGTAASRMATVHLLCNTSGVIYSSVTGSSGITAAQAASGDYKCVISNTSGGTVYILVVNYRGAAPVIS